MKRFLALLLAALFFTLPFSALGEGNAEAESGDMKSSVYRLEPRYSDGVEVRENYEGSMEIMAHEDGDYLVFDESKSLVVEVILSDGWSLCTRYSSFFTGDSRAYLLNPESGVYEYFFDAEAGGRVKLSVWNSVAINASCSELPKLYINAEASFDEIGKTEWVDASFSLTLGTKEFKSGEYEGSGQVKGRGNTSWGYPKKPYSIKLDSKASLLDIPKTKKYAIIPSYTDGTLIRNFITYKVFQGLEGIGYVPKCELVDVYLNGEYNGIYILVERIAIEKSKIDIDEADADNLTGGYLIEKDVTGKVDFNSDLWFDCPYWANQTQDYFVMKGPEPNDPQLVNAMLDYLTGFMQNVHDCIIGENGEDYTRYVDVSSWVDFIIVQEISKNIDGNFKTSCYMYKEKDDDHLYMTAPWDFDFAYGRVSWNNQSAEHNDVDDCPDANTPEGFMCVNSSNPWMDKLYDTKPEFRRALMERYTQYRHTLIDELFAMIEEQAAYLSIVQEPNYQLWNKPFNVAVTNLKNWLTNRIAWLDEQWLIEEPSYQLGDVNMDGIIDSNDALLLLRFSLGLADLGDGMELADVNDDGEVSLDDALIVLRIALGMKD